MKKLILAAAALLFVAACEETPPPPATQTTTTAVRQFMVFFDFDRANITQQAAATIKQAADTAKMGTAAAPSSEQCAADGRRRGMAGEALNKFIAECTAGGGAMVPGGARTADACAAEGRRRGISGEALSQFVAQCTAPAVTRIAVTGHTDTSGSPTYNMALSLRRANAVKDELVRQGIPAAAISVTGRGETQLLVQTGDNVKEPQNRRVEIVLQ